MNECGSQSLQMALRELDNSYQRFFKQLGGYPNFKSKKNNHQSFTAPQNIKIENNKTYLPKFIKDGIKTKFHRDIPKDAILKQATISRTNNQYFISILVDDNIPTPKPIKAKNAVGLDVGTETLITTSDYVKYPNLRHTKKYEQKLKKIQKALSKKQHSRKKGDTTPKSNNYLKQLKKVQKLHTKIYNSRKDYLHKISNEITNQYDIICLESLNIKGMVKNNQEGFVVRFSNGDRVKIKGEEYLRLHRIMTHLSTTAIWEVLSNGGDILSTLTDVPDEFYDKIHQYSNELMDKYTKIENEYHFIFKILSRSDDFEFRASFAELAKKHKHPAILFKMYDDKDYSGLIWKIIKPEFEKL